MQCIGGRLQRKSKLLMEGQPDGGWSPAELFSIVPPSQLLRAIHGLIPRGCGDEPGMSRLWRFCRASARDEIATSSEHSAEYDDLSVVAGAKSPRDITGSPQNALDEFVVEILRRVGLRGGKGEAVGFAPGSGAAGVGDATVRHDSKNGGGAGAGAAASIPAGGASQPLSVDDAALIVRALRRFKVGAYTLGDALDAILVAADAVDPAVVAEALTAAAPHANLPNLPL